MNSSFSVVKPDVGLRFAITLTFFDQSLRRFSTSAVYVSSALDSQRPEVIPVKASLPLVDIDTRSPRFDFYDFPTSRWTISILLNKL